MAAARCAVSSVRTISTLSLIHIYSTDAENTSEQTFDENTDVSETPVISEQMLYEPVSYTHLDVYKRQIVA